MIFPRRRHLGNETERATFDALHSVTLAAPPLRDGLTAASAEKAIGHLRSLLNSPAVALTDTVGLLAWDGAGGAPCRPGPGPGGGHLRGHGYPDRQPA